MCLDNSMILYMMIAMLVVGVVLVAASIVICCLFFRLLSKFIPLHAANDGEQYSEVNS